jgi:hypothetical protein
VPDLSDLERRLSASCSTADILAAAWDAFEQIRATARLCEPDAGDAFAAFAMAAATAVQARNLLSAAPSMPPGPGTRPPDPGLRQPVGADDAADGLAAFAATLSTTLTSAARRACDIQDRQACELAAAHATAIHALLTLE